MLLTTTYSTGMNSRLRNVDASMPPATAVPVDAIRRFLDGQHVTPATGRSGVDAAKASVVRVICVRK